MIMFVLAGVLSALVFTFTGPNFPYEFIGINDSLVFISKQFNDTIKYDEVENIRLLKEYENSDCNGNNRIYNSIGEDICQRTGLVLFANENFTDYNGNNKGPWQYTILETGNHLGIQSFMKLREDCSNKMNNILQETVSFPIYMSFLWGLILIVFIPRDKNITDTQSGPQPFIPNEHATINISAKYN